MQRTTSFVSHWPPKSTNEYNAKHKRNLTHNAKDRRSALKRQRIVITHITAHTSVENHNDT